VPDRGCLSLFENEKRSEEKDMLSMIPPEPELFYSRDDPMDPRLGDLVKPVSRDIDEALKSSQIALVGVTEASREPPWARRPFAGPSIA